MNQIATFVVGVVVGVLSTLYIEQCLAEVLGDQEEQAVEQPAEEPTEPAVEPVVEPGPLKPQPPTEPQVVAYFFTGTGWCTYCKPVHDVVDKLFGEGYRVSYYEFGERKDKEEQYGVDAVPTIVLCKNGQVIDKLRGQADEQTIRKFLEPAGPAIPMAAKPPENPRPPKCVPGSGCCPAKS